VVDRIEEQVGRALETRGGVSLSLLVLKTRQSERLRTFYAALGVAFATEQHGAGPIHVAGQIGDVVFEIYPLSGDGPADSTTRLGFTVDDLGGLLVRLQALGVPVISPPRRSDWGLRAVVRDPDGRAVELVQR